VILTAHNLTMASVIDTPAETRLPAKCSSCGGNVHPEEVEWSGTHFAACAYCGSKLEIEV
jgi:DNA-directed RNA polymerase subunit RPC12/RpoP